MPRGCCKRMWKDIPDDEPAFTIRGRDVLAISAVRHYLSLAEDAHVNHFKLATIKIHLEDIARFQSIHPERCKLPD